MSSFLIKIIAIISMAIDHTNYILDSNVVLNQIGRIAFPLFCFQIVVGYAKTKSLSKYIYRLLLFAFISQIPYMWFMKIVGGEGIYLNVLFTLALGLIAMYIYDLQITTNNGELCLIDKNRKKSFTKTKNC